MLELNSDNGLNHKIIFSDSVFAQEVDGEMVLLDMDSENYFGLDEVGCDIWQALQQSAQLQEVYNVLLEQYEVDPERLKQDLFVFVEQLGEAGLLRIE